jgi:hypothetical protein
VWARADVALHGDPALQQAVRFALFQVVQASARAERRAIPAKGLTGRGYDGHTFWTWRRTRCRCSRTRSRRRRKTRSCGVIARWTSRRSARASSASPA